MKLTNFFRVSARGISSTFIRKPSTIQQEFTTVKNELKPTVRVVDLKKFAEKYKYFKESTKRMIMLTEHVFVVDDCNAPMKENLRV